MVREYVACGRWELLPDRALFSVAVSILGLSGIGGRSLPTPIFVDVQLSRRLTTSIVTLL
jgi:hypothetical protein